MSDMNENGVDVKRRRFITMTSSAVGAVGVAAAAVPFVVSMSPSERAKAAGAPVEVDISKLEPGQMVRVEWRGKPVFILNRTKEMEQGLNKVTPELKDPDSVDPQQPGYAQNEFRSLKPDLLVMVGLCTHLGCAPVDNFEVGAASGLGDDWQGGFFCPCHGSKFDLAGRVYSGVPAQQNMVIPPYSYIDDNHILIGVNPEGVA